MIQVNELRIGSWVEVNEKQLQVKSLHPNAISCIDGEDEVIFADKYIASVSPIALTPAVLERSGFEKSVWESHNTGAPTNVDVYTLGGITFNGFQNAWYYRASLIYKEPKHLHQLQNLFFALTGAEINYKPI